jgi:cell division GTPase FtsZ
MPLKQRNGEFGSRDFHSIEGDENVADKPNQDQLDKSLAAAGGLKGTPAKQPQMAPVPPVTPAATPPGVPPTQAAPPVPPVNAPPGLGNVAASIAPASHEKAAKEVVVDDAFEHDVAYNMSFLGAGQGGGRIANAFYGLGYRRVAALNTTEMDFDGLDENIHKLDLGVGGAAKDAEFANAQLEGREEEVWDLLTRAWGNTTDYGLVCVGLGGGTGSGTSPKLVEVARKYLESKGKEPRVGAIVSLPTVNEGQLVARNAINTFKHLLEIKASPIVIIDNAKINQLYRPAMSKLHEVANSTVSQLFHLFNSLCEAPNSVYTFDRSEFAQLLNGGIVVMGAAALQEVNSPADVSTAIRDQLTGNVLAEVDLRKGKKGCCLFVASQAAMDAYPEEYFAAGFDQLERTLGAAYKKTEVEPVVHRGLTVGEHDGVQVYMMISELDPPMKRLEELAKKAGYGRDSIRSSMAAFLGVDDAKA